MDRLKSILKFLFLTLPIIYVVSKVDFSAFMTDIQAVPLSMILIAIMFLLIRIALQSLRFSILTRPFTSEIGFSKLLIADLKAKYYSIIIPSSVGQDIVRGTLLKEHLSPDEIVGISLFFRLTGVLPLLVLSTIGLISLANIEELRTVLPYLLLMACLLTLFTLILLSKRLSRKVGKKLAPILPTKVMAFIRQSVTAIQLFRNHFGIAITNIGISFITQLIFVSFSSILLKAITGDFYFIAAMSFIPVIEIISILIPITFNGFGVREFGYMIMFEYLDESDESRALFITLSLLLYLMNLMGIAVIAFEKLFVKRRLDGTSK